MSVAVERPFATLLESTMFLGISSRCDDSIDLVDFRQSRSFRWLWFSFFTEIIAWKVSLSWLISLHGFLARVLGICSIPLCHFLCRDPSFEALMNLSCCWPFLLLPLINSLLTHNRLIEGPSLPEIHGTLWSLSLDYLSSLLYLSITGLFSSALNNDPALCYLRLLFCSHWGQWLHQLRARHWRRLRDLLLLPRWTC